MVQPLRHITSADLCLTDRRAKRRDDETTTRRRGDEATRTFPVLLADMNQVNNKSKQGNQPAAKEECTEEQLEEGLKQLKLLHIKASTLGPVFVGATSLLIYTVALQCRALRTTLPVMLEPLSTRHASGTSIPKERRLPKGVPYLRANPSSINSRRHFCCLHQVRRQRVQTVIRLQDPVHERR